MTFQRVNAENIRSISKSIEVVRSKLNNFTISTALYSNSTLRRIGGALVKIKQLVKNDVDAMGNIVNNYKQAYDNFLGAKINHLLNFLDSANDNLDYLLLRSEKGPWDFSIDVPNVANRGVNDYGWSAFTQAMGVFDVLRVSLKSIEDINSMVPIADLEEDVRNDLPLSLWSSNERWQTCDELFKREAKTYRYVLKMFYDMLYIWQESSVTEGWPEVWITKLNLRKRKISTLKSCANEYRDTITNALNDLTSIQSVAEDVLNTGTSFDFLAFDDFLREDIKTISFSESWLYLQLKKYHSYNSSKLAMAQTLLNAKTQEQMVRHMEAVLFKIDLDAIFKLKTEAQSLKKNIQKWYVAGISAISYLIDYFERDGVESKMRNMSLWRKPVVDLRTPGVLKYSYSFEETWQTWPASVPLQNLITADGIKYISDILEGYMRGINEALYEVQHALQATKEETAAEFDALGKALQSYVRQSQIDDSFIR